MEKSFSKPELQFIESTRVARLASLGETGPDGTLRPHCIPVCYAYFEGEFLIALDEKPKSGKKLRRVRNIEGHPSVTLLLDHYEDDWSKLAFLMIEGRARISMLTGGQVGALRERYPQYREMELSEAIVIVPERAVFWRS